MKKLPWIISLLVLCALVVGAEEEGVLSRNAVGYVKVTVPKGIFVMLQSPFEQLDGSVATITEVVGTDVPVGTVANVWNSQSQEWVKETFSKPFIGDPKWTPGTTELPRGKGAFVKIPDSAAEESYDIYLMGEVPDQFTAPSSDMDIVEGFQMIGYMYPVEKKLSETEFATSATIGDKIYLMDDGNWIPANFTKPFIGAAQWQPDLVLKPGAALFYKSGDDKEFNFEKPYDYP